MAAKKDLPESSRGLHRITDMIDDVSFDELVYYKLRRFIDKLDIEDEDNLLEMIIQRVELPLIRLVLDKCDNNKSRAAKVLGVNRATLVKKLDKVLNQTV